MGASGQAASGYQLEQVRGNSDNTAEKRFAGARHLTTWEKFRTLME
jgi:hypothetical protein